MTPLDIATRIAHVQDRIAAAATRATRQADGVTLVAVTKGWSLDEIREAWTAGVTEFGESRIQEAEPKITALPRLHWHLVGHLQRNKARRAVSLFSVIHSVDSERLAADLSARMTAQRPIDVLLQVNIAGDQRKFGIPPRSTPAMVRAVNGMSGLRIIGLMTIAPQTDNPETVRPVFRRLRDLRDEIRASGIAGDEFEHLSMGMTDDFEVAIEEGATMVRIGRAIFGERM